MPGPNILIVYPDTLGANAVHCYGNQTVHTPNIDRLADTGVRFTNCTSANPVCQPSRMSLHSGKYVSTHGLHDNGLEFYPVEHTTFARFLRRHGYTTAYYGKTHAVHPPDWDELFDLYPDYNTYLKAHGIDVTYPEKPPLKDLCHGRSEIPSKHWATNVLGNLGVNYIRQQASSAQPFLLFMSFEAPHGPVTYPRDEPDLYDPEAIALPDTPEEALDTKPLERKLYMQARGSLAKSDDTLRYALSMYYSMVTLMDRNVGRLIQALDDTGQRENTVVLVLSDHGDFMGNHRCVGKGLSVDHSLIHVPLILNCPSRFATRTVHGLVESIDVFPTLTELAGVEAPPLLQGRSLLPLALGRTTEGKAFAFSEEFYGVGPHFFAVRDREYKLTVSSTGVEELYHIASDPWEWHNLADDPAFRERLSVLKTAMLQWRFRCVEHPAIRQENFIQWLLEGKTEKLPPYLGGPER